MAKKARILSHHEAKVEDMEYFLSLSPTERLRALNQLRLINYGEKAMAPAVKIAQLIPLDD